MADPALNLERQGPFEDSAYSTAATPIADATGTVAVPLIVRDEAASPVVDSVANLAVMMPRAIYPFGWSRTNVRRFVGLMAGALLALIFLWQVNQVVLPFLIAFFLAALLDPSLRAMERQGRSRLYSILLLYLLGLIFIITIAVFLVPLAMRQILDISENLGSYTSSIQTSVNEFIVHHAKLLHTFGIKDHSVSQLLADKSLPVQNTISTFLNSASDVAAGAVSKLYWFIIIPVAGFFFMRDFPGLRARLIWLCPDRHQERVDQLSREIVDVFSDYLRGLAKICALYAVCAFLLFELLNLHYAIFLGLLAGLFYAVPYVGNLITATSAAAIAYLMNPHRVFIFWHVPAHSTAYALLTGIACIVLANIVFDQLVYPRVVGGSVGLHPVASLFALASGATLFGVWGMLLATPVAASIQIVLTYLIPRLKQSPPAHLLDPKCPPA